MTRQFARVLDDGWLVELGSQAELLARDGLYARLHRTQFAEPVIQGVTEDLDGIDGAWERAEQGRAEADAGDGIALRDL